MADVVALSTLAVFVLAMAMCLRALDVKPVIWASAALAPILVVLSSPSWLWNEVISGTALVCAGIFGLFLVFERWPRLAAVVAAGVAVVAAARAAAFPPSYSQGWLFEPALPVTLAPGFSEGGRPEDVWRWSSGLPLGDYELVPQSAWVVFGVALGLMVGVARKRIGGSKFLQSLTTFVVMCAISLFIDAAYGQVAPLAEYWRAILGLELFTGGPAILFWPFLAVAAFYLGERIAASAVASRAPRPAFLTVGAAL